jgi:hypothetical protein
MTKNKIFKDVNVMATDASMTNTYTNLSNSSFINIQEHIPTLNLSCREENVLSLEPLLRDHFYLIMGSSNFHHLDIVNIKRICEKKKEKLQLLLIDQHMDCQQYDNQKKELHCGNWISYAYQKNYLSKIAIAGSRDFRELQSFDHSLAQDSILCVPPSLQKLTLENFFSKDLPVYISIDTDVLDVPNDWGRGKESLENILNAPFWHELREYNIIGACIHGHVTDNRKFLDIVSKAFHKDTQVSQQFSLTEVKEYILHALLPKLWASITTRPLPLEQQRDIIWSFYQKIESIR